MVTYKYWCWLIVGGALFFMSCQSPRKSTYASRVAVNKLADSLLRDGLDHEALYSLLDSLKPMSSIGDVSFTFLPSSDDSVALWHQAFQQLSTLHSSRQFFLVPFQRADSASRSFAGYVVHSARWENIIRQYADFFRQQGIYPTTPPGQAVTVIDRLPRHARWRAYGYLFGYPAYAVDFFVSAGVQQDSTRVFVPRDFRHIPVFAADSGHFTYAVPKGYPLQPVDSTIAQHAAQVLRRYQANRHSLFRQTGWKNSQRWAKKQFNN